MARTHKTAYIKEQMAERARQEEEARRKVVSARSDHKRCKRPATHGPLSSAPMRPQKALHPLVMRRKTRKRSKRKKRSLKKRKKPTKLKKMQTKKKTNRTTKMQTKKKTKRTTEMKKSKKMKKKARRRRKRRKELPKGRSAPFPTSKTRTWSTFQRSRLSMTRGL
ncbi:hypothetical protein PF007_g18754 [Phytophthora fragariae]|uniref:Uncharacterized protein n=1 Tax=Phytophthora fragariae TaxID=53985 RepID=A0A6A3R831_9STRA|nr:hypothetical protein PF007_g18754 [Phytophthora fragariae]